MAGKDPLDHDGDGRKGGAAKLVPIRLLRDLWGDDGERISADGSVIQRPAAEARRLIDTGAAEPGK